MVLSAGIEPSTTGAALWAINKSAPVAVNPTAGSPLRCNVLPEKVVVGTRFRLASNRGRVVPLPGKLPLKSA